MQNHSSDGLIPQEREGCIPVVKVGAKRGTGIDSLLENIVLVAELQGLKANPDREAKGTVVNASLDNARGPLATLPVQNGTLLKEDFVLCGEAHVKPQVDAEGVEIRFHRDICGLVDGIREAMPWKGC
ncbi:translation initiation factor IF-2, chloroplastic isoform X1 [Physcomitrium patens]|uniref:translation initiation factor IF-2, chloroplastic isoform X1 n=1 Tax=Physcomitrium patens TaxID=3218 RepID=UPI000D161210|nr:translation initiation factor IF-2, chloroplastic-like isoform X1 [Physcomitrium patens]XP_024369192.1 translation initiation factor IF-2, chloroplastic-like isoform X1 [Physcomitrium patens]XP_024369194.1 translation initiation factor IF-2, chloroplastic-like isoform X1 [Physcomitrium patens]|eukprot:XP_024369191.1 translation initiation factor IF-2, chloroplastic-like isoform X1 [Physcomitrella patens]